MTDPKLTFMIKNKRIHFITGFPRCGNTLLGSILNQNPKINATAHSITPDIMANVDNIKSGSVESFQHWTYRTFPDERSLDNVLKNIFNLYYKDWSGDIILERGDWLTPYNFNLLSKYFDQDIRIVVLVRTITDIIKSYIYLCNKYPKFHINIDYERLDPTTLYKSPLEEKCDLLMQKGSYIDCTLFGIKWLLDNDHNEKLLFVEYDDLVSDTISELKRIYGFLDIEFYNHNLSNLSQFKANGVGYNDEFVGGDMHTIRVNKVEKVDHGIKLPSKVIAKYSGLESWR